MSSNRKASSREKKQHTLKNTLIATTLGWIVFLGKTAAGSTHDFTLLKEEFESDWLEEYFLCVDLGYQGIDKYYAHKGLIQAVKKKKGQKLNQHEKDYSRAVSRLRIKVEHGLPTRASTGVRHCRNETLLHPLP